jgi:hypothetical protein
MLLSALALLTDHATVPAKQGDGDHDGRRHRCGGSFDAGSEAHHPDPARRQRLLGCDGHRPASATDDPARRLASPRTAWRSPPDGERDLLARRGRAHRDEEAAHQPDHPDPVRPRRLADRRVRRDHRQGGHAANAGAPPGSGRVPRPLQGAGRDQHHPVRGQLHPGRPADGRPYERRRLFRRRRPRRHPRGPAEIRLPDRHPARHGRVGARHAAAGPYRRGRGPPRRLGTRSLRPRRGERLLLCARRFGRQG